MGMGIFAVIISISAIIKGIIYFKNRKNEIKYNDHHQKMLKRLWMCSQNNNNAAWIKAEKQAAYKYKYKAEREKKLAWECKLRKAFDTYKVFYEWKLFNNNRIAEEEKKKACKILKMAEENKKKVWDDIIRTRKEAHKAWEESNKKKEGSKYRKLKLKEYDELSYKELELGIYYKKMYDGFDVKKWK